MSEDGKQVNEADLDWLRERDQPLNDALAESVSGEPPEIALGCLDGIGPLTDEICPRTVAASDLQDQARKWALELYNVQKMNAEAATFNREPEVRMTFSQFVQRLAAFAAHILGRKE